ncbi:MAG: NAD-dependent epimerase/dehydratase family protein [Thermoanaerobaculia bacterium]
MRRVLVTGGAGFVGRRFVRHFLEAGDAVTCVDRLAPGTGAVAPDAGWSGGFQPFDFERFRFDRNDCRAFFRDESDTDFDLAIHLAAMVGGRLMIERNPLAVAEDLAIDSDYWQWARRARPKKTICFSSSAAYPVRLQTRENHVLLKEEMIDFDGDIGRPDLTYGWAKLTCEYLARLAFQHHGLESVVYRPFSGYGADQDDTYPFPSLVKRAMANVGAATLEVWGTGDQMRDFIHIDDCLAGVLATMDAIQDAGAVNLSTGLLTSFKQFASLAANACGYDPHVVGLSQQPEGVFARGGDTTKQEMLGFRSSIRLEHGIRRAIAIYSGATAEWT